jgi:hypothetical protein
MKGRINLRRWIWVARAAVGGYGMHNFDARVREEDLNFSERAKSKESENFFELRVIGKIPRPNLRAKRWEANGCIGHQRKGGTALIGTCCEN